MANQGLSQAVDALLMAFTTAQMGDGSSMGPTVAAVYSERFKDLQVDANDCQCGGTCPVVGRAAMAGAAAGGEIVAEHLALELALLGELVEATGNPDYQALLQKILDEAPG